MQKLIKENKKLIIGGGIVAIAAGAYIYFTKKTSDK